MLLLRLQLLLEPSSGAQSYKFMDVRISGLLSAAVSHGFGFASHWNPALACSVGPPPSHSGWQSMWFCGFYRNYEHVTKSTKLINKLCRALPLPTCHVTVLILPAIREVHKNQIPLHTVAYTHVCLQVCASHLHRYYLIRAGSICHGYIPQSLISIEFVTWLPRYKYQKANFKLREIKFYTKCR